MLIDSHCHLDFDSFDEDIKETIERASKVGVKKMLTICTHFSRFDKVLALANTYDNLFCSVGVHPHHVQEAGFVTADELITATKNPKVIGIGETGLDFYYDHSPREEQRKHFRAFIRLARELDLPLSMHVRDAYAEAAAILGEEGAGKVQGVMHCFTGNIPEARALLELGLSLSFSGIVTFKSAQSLRDVVPIVPLDRMLIETDCPYLAPVPYRGKRNEPGYVCHVATMLAGVKGLSLEEVATATWRNTAQLFRLDS